MNKIWTLVNNNDWFISCDKCTIAMYAIKAVDI